MKVKELIAKLQEFDGELEVLVDDEDMDDLVRPYKVEDITMGNDKKLVKISATGW